MEYGQSGIDLVFIFFIFCKGLFEFTYQFIVSFLYLGAYIVVDIVVSMIGNNGIVLLIARVRLGR